MGNAGHGLSADIVEGLGFELMSVARWSEDSSAVDVVRVTPRLSVVASRGPGHPGSKPFYTEHATGICEVDQSVIFWDLGGLTSTDIGVVRTCLGIGKANRHNLAMVHMYYDSPLVGMAITVANVALGGLLELYRAPEPFVEAFTQACTDAGAERERPRARAARTRQTAGHSPQ